MITRQDIINELLKMPNLDQAAKRQHISQYLEFNEVSESDREKILDDLVSYAEF